MSRHHEVAEAFLVTRQRGSWREVFRLTPGQILTVGRGQDNRVVVRDDRCSRRHCDLYDENSTWHIRDLESRNGTLVNGTRVSHDRSLEDGDVIRIGDCEMLFTTDISQPLDRFLEDRESDGSGTTDSGSRDAGPEIVERTSHHKFAASSERPPAPERGENVRRGFAGLYRLIVRMMAASDVRTLAETAIDGLLAGVGADIGAVLLFPQASAAPTDPDALRIMAYRAPEGTPYQKVSRRLSLAALKEREAILARDLGQLSGKGEFETLADLRAESVICAPIRGVEGTFGLLHVYSLHADRILDAEALEFTLAVGDQLASTLVGLQQTEQLATGLKRARDRNRSLVRLLEQESDLVGDSPALQQLRETIARVAASDAVTLVRGESGVGKELVARAVHLNSNRREAPFVCLNCAALTETLLESELFGHEKGAFTGATERKVGKFEQADGGTLFLDEVGEMSPAVQAKFLRVLEGHPFERVGGQASVCVNVRVVAATNSDLEEAVEKGEFRKDLFFRLHILEIHVPPLRDHRSDIPRLADYFLERCCRRLGRASMRFSAEALRRLGEYAWPGNVRELKSVVERAVVLTDGDEIQADCLRFVSAPQPSMWLDEDPMWGYEELSLDDVERIHIARTMRWTKWKKREAARILGINRSTLDRKLQRYGIQPPTDDT